MNNGQSARIWRVPLFPWWAGRGSRKACRLVRPVRHPRPDPPPSMTVRVLLRANHYDDLPHSPAFAPSPAREILHGFSPTASHHRRHALVPSQCYPLDSLTRSLAEAGRFYAAVAGGGGGAAGTAGIDAGVASAEGLSITAPLPDARRGGTRQPRACYRRRATMTAAPEPAPTVLHQARSIHEPGAPARPAASSRWSRSSAWQRSSNSSRPSGPPCCCR